MQTRKTRAKGFTLTEVLIVVSIVSMLASIGIPKYIRAQAQSQKQSCIYNLKQLDGAVQQWAMDYKKKSNDAVTEVAIAVYLKNNAIPDEPASGGYQFTIVSETPTCTLGPTLGHTY